MPIPTQSPALPRRLLRDEAYDRIASAIILGQFAPGEKLNDQEIAAWLSISRTPVREALARLERAGLVRTVPGRMTVVSDFDSGVTEQAVNVAGVLHAMAVRIAAPLTTEEDVQAMRAANWRLAQALTEDDVAAAVSADDAFHRVAVERAANGMLINALDLVTPLVHRAEHLGLGSLVTGHSVDQHAAILLALQEHDAEAAEAASVADWLPLTA